MKLSPFSPPPLLAGAHIQTILPYYLRTMKGITWKRERLTTPDEDFLDLDFLEFPSSPPGPPKTLALLIHGLEGDSKSGYIAETARQLAPYGIHAVALNHRGCSGETNHAPRAYHSGETGDLDFVITSLVEKFPAVPLVAVGFSLGGNMLIKYLGERGETTPLRAGVAVSPPFNLGRGADRMASGFNRVYTQTFLSRLKEKTRAKTDHYRDLVDLPTVLSARNLREFDNTFVAPIYGFQDADDYYAQASSGQFLAGIRIPTLVIRSKDDPFFDPTDIPYDVLNTNPFLTPAITDKGGHVGFMEGVGRYWAEREAARFLSHCVQKIR